ncbi:BspA family leucine-rich repeat surface protein [Mesoplasma tabanidae]|uniref:Lipoprotein n=1 Tax=Mesoplasma tabanidae TaxID=219745 RepID=A0A2K8P4M7_9MOLU|nr:BspA family leucine-rich repeat surface protein [Mesoplasma tabanidae]ATZ21704.1 hypothetical protein MTABA_v1c05060 [Mesoplasma tabanidae]
MKKLLVFFACLSLTANLIILAVSCSKETIHLEDLDSVILNKNLNKLEGNDEQTVKNALSKENPTLDISEIKLTIAAVSKNVETKNYTVTVEPIDNSNVYSGKVHDITFYTETIHIQDLDSVILNKNLNKLEGNDEQTVKNALSKENPTLDISEIKLTIAAVSKNVETKNYTVTVEPIDNSNVYSGKVHDITFYTETINLQDLDNVILNKNLNKLEDNDEQTVKNALSKENPTLDISEIKLTIAAVSKNVETKNYTVTVEPIDNSNVYSGKVHDITFYTETINLQDLDNVILNKNLNKLEDNDEQTVKNALSKENPTLDISEIKLTIAAVSKNVETKNYTVTVEPIDNSNVYSGKVEGIVFYTEKISRQNLSNVVLRKNLSKIKNNEFDTILLALKNKNEELVTEEIKIDNVQGWQTNYESKKYKVIISAIPNSNLYFGKVEEIYFWNETYVDNLTYYVDKNTLDEKSIDGSAPDGTNKITHIGYSSDKQAYKLPKSTIYVPDVISPEITNISSLFENVGNSGDQLTFPGISYWETSNIIDMSNLFNNARIKDVNFSNWDTSNVINMRLMFYNVDFLNNSFSNWNTSKVKDMSYMFQRSGKFSHNESFCFLKWDTSNVVNMEGMFLEAFPWLLNNGISNWKTHNVENMDSMFANTNFNVDISRWVTSKVTNMSFMFYNCSSFNFNLSEWDVDNVDKHDNYDTGTSQWSPAYKPNFKQKLCTQ